ERNNRHRHQHSSHRNDWRQHEQLLVDEARDPVLLENELHHVGDGLADPERADTVGAVPVLPQAEQPPLQPDQVGDDEYRRQQDDDHLHDLEQQRDQLGREPTHHAAPPIVATAPAASTGMLSMPSGRPMQPSGNTALICTGRVSAWPSMTTSTDCPALMFSATAAALEITAYAAGIRVCIGAARAESSSLPKICCSGRTRYSPVTAVQPAGAGP